MRGMDFIGIVLLFFLSLWGALYLEAAMGPYFLFELFVILLLIIVSIGILYAILSNKKWAWHSAAGFFLVALINCVFVFYLTRDKVPFAVCLFVNIAGLGTSFVKSSGNFLFDHNFQKPKSTPRPRQMPLPRPAARPSPAVQPEPAPKPAPEHTSKLWSTQQSTKPYYHDDSDVLVELETYNMDSDILAPMPKPARKKAQKKKSARKSSGKKKSRKKKR